MKQIWNTFCEDISRNRGVKEMTFEKEIVKGFLQALGWSRYDRNLEEQSGMYGRKWIPDFTFYLNNDKNAKEIILELKKPDHKQRKVDIEQIEAYMKLSDCRFGLYFGEKLEVFYLQEKDGKRSAVSVTNIDWTIDNEAGANFIELLVFKGYDRKRLEDFCKENVELNTFIRQWKTQKGQQKLYEAIIEHFALSPEMANTLQSVLKFTIVESPEIIISSQNTVSAPIKTDSSKPHQRKNFDFSMAGLMKGDVITFSPTGTKVKVSSRKHISYKGKNYTLTGFCKAFLPEEMRNSSGAYQGPRYFEYKGKSLVDIRFEREEKGFDNPEPLMPKEGDKIFCVKVGKVGRESLYERTRKHWKVRYDRARQATHVFAVVDGIVEAVYIPQVWKRSTGSRVGRCEFEGVEDVNSEYLGKSVVDFYGKSQNPCLYINM